jgi:hypothetical protein
MLSVLSAGLGDLRGQLGVTSSLALLLGSEVAREEHRRARESIVASLEGLQKAARLSNILGTDSALVFHVLIFYFDHWPFLVNLL